MSVQSLARPELWKQAGYHASGYTSQESMRLHCNENPWPPVGAVDPLIHRYPEKQPLELLHRLAGLYQVQPDQLLITRGADDGIDALIRSFCQPARDAIAQCPPAFVMYEFFARLQGLQTINVPLLAGDGFAVNFQQLHQHQAKIFFLCSPNNPTGSTIDPQELLEFASRVEERALVVLDEAYIEFSEFDSLARQATQRSNLVVLRTLSKAWSLAGARLGVVIACQETIRYLRATTSPYPLSRAAVASALSATAEPNLATAENRIHEIRQQREKLRQSLQSLGFVHRVYPGQGNFLLLHVQDAARLMEFTGQQGIQLRDQSSQPGLANHVRISIGTPSEMDRLLELLHEFAGESP